MIKKNYYEILGIDKNANTEEIKRAFKKLAMKYHPDRNPNNPKAEEKFKSIKEAYDILNDSNKRYNYDNYGIDTNNTYQNNNNTFDFGNFFTNLGDTFEFTNDTNDTNDNNDNYYNNNKINYNLTENLEISFNESIFGTSKILNINYYKFCIYCKGSGKNLSKKKTCINCKGKGSIINNSFKSTIHYIFKQTCSKCSGTGYIFTSNCTTCFGIGKIKDSKIINVKIPAGIENNGIIKLKGQGISNKSGNYTGDILIKIKVHKHSFFIRKKNNLYCEFTINFVIAAIGGEIMLPTLTEKKIKLKIPAGIQTGHIFKIKGKGVNTLNNPNKGDLFCTIKIETPINLTENQINLFKELSLSENNSFKKNKKFRN